RRVAPVEADPAHARGEVDHHVRAVDRLARAAVISQIEVGGARRSHARSERLQVAHHGRPEEPGTPGHGHRAAVPEPGIGLRAHYPLSLTARPESWSSNSFTSASTMICTSSLNVTVGSHPNRSRALLASPH